MACANVIVACQYIDHGIIAHHCLTPFPTVGSMVTTDMVLKAFKGAWSVFTFLFYFIFYFFTFFPSNLGNLGIKSLYFSHKPWEIFITEIHLEDIW